jgi:hypothetical protein
MHRGDRSSPKAAAARTRDLQKALQDSGIESIRTASAWLEPHSDYDTASPDRRYSLG